MEITFLRIWPRWMPSRYRWFCREILKLRLTSSVRDFKLKVYNVRACTIQIHFRFTYQRTIGSLTDIRVYCCSTPTFKQYVLSITYLMFVGYSSGVYRNIVLYEPVILNFPTRVKMVEQMTIAELPSVERNKRTMSDLPSTLQQLRSV